ncbi:golgin subfamily A member 4-like protein [Dinothrombium tinctorium]|uniref:Golgin subfamily A member 4-like protein n=1 Tax=Dinothrombium tinctorium TaxID=1965070 RepID=A0A3S3PQH0_9ACAR|nr:golgin subfamily A member 4-like protein [Dinothrombium tinctorium]
MFKRFKDKLTEEVSKGQQYLDNWVANTQVASGLNSSLSNAAAHDSHGKNHNHSQSSVDPVSESSKDLLSFNDSGSESSKIIDSQSDEVLGSKHENLGSFSLVDLEDDESHKEHSGVSSPATQKSMSQIINDDSFTLPSYQYLSSVSSPSVVLQSDVESEYDSEPQPYSLNVESLTKESLASLFMRLREKAMKYRNRYSDVVKAYRSLNEDNQKMRKVMVETQDKAVRRLQELKEQCLLEEQAKRHLEENLRVMLEEKDEKIKALETKVEYYQKGSEEDEKSSETAKLQEKVQRLEAVLSRCKETLKTNKEKVNALTKENVELINFRDIAEKVRKENEALKQESEELSLKLAESKKSLHEELEERLRELQDLKHKYDLVLKDKHSFEDSFKTADMTCKQLEERIKQIEKTSEEDRENLLQELSRGKAAAIHLIKASYHINEESEKKIQCLDEEWKDKYDSLLKEKSQLEESLNAVQSDTTQAQIEETRNQNEQLKLEIKECKEKLEKTIEDLNKSQQEREMEKMDLEKLLEESKNYSENLKNEIDQLTVRSSAFDNINDRLQKKEVLLTEMEQKVEEAKVELESLRKQLQEKDAILEKFTKLKENEESSNDTYKEIADRLQQTLKLKEEMETNHKEVVAKYNNEIQSLNSQLNKLKEENSSLLENMNQKLEETEARQLENVKKMEDNVKLLDEQANEARNQISHLSELVESREKEIERLKTYSSDLNSQISHLKSSLEESESKCKLADELQLKLKEIEKNLDNTVKALEDSNEKLNVFRNFSAEESLRLQTQLQDTQNELEKSEERYRQMNASKEEMENKMRETNIHLENVIKELKLENEELKNEIMRFQTELSKLIEESIRNEEELKHEIEELKTQSKLESLSLIEENICLVEKCCHLDEAQEKLNEKEELLHRLKRKLQNNNCSLNSLRKKLIEKAKMIDDLNATCNEKTDLEKELRNNYEKVLNENNELKSKIAGLEENITKTIEIHEYESLKSEKTRIENLLNECRNECELLRTNKSALEEKCSNLNDLNAKLEEKEKLLNVAEEKVVEAFKQIECLKNDLNEKEKYLLEVKQSIENQIASDYESKIKALEKQLGDMRRSKDELENSYKASVANYLNEIQTLKSNIQKVQNENEANVERLYKQLELRETQLEENLMTAESQQNSTIQELIETRNQVQKLNERIEAMKDKLLHEHKQAISALESELNEKSVALEEVHDYYHQRLQEKEEQLKQLHDEFGSSSVNEHSFQVKAMQKSLMQYQEENVKLKELLAIRNNAVSSSNNSNIYMPEPTEYEYLRNILFEYMMGREPETLAKVIAAVLRFNNEQTEQILRRQEVSLANALRP